MCDVDSWQTTQYNTLWETCYTQKQRRMAEGRDWSLTRFFRIVVLVVVTQIDFKRSTVVQLQCLLKLVVTALRSAGRLSRRRSPRGRTTEEANKSSTHLTSPFVFLFLLFDTPITVVSSSRTSFSMKEDSRRVKTCKGTHRQSQSNTDRRLVTAVRSQTIQYSTSRLQMNDWVETDGHNMAVWNACRCKFQSVLVNCAWTGDYTQHYDHHLLVQRTKSTPFFNHHAFAWATQDVSAV